MESRLNPRMNCPAKTLGDWHDKINAIVKETNHDISTKIAHEFKGREKHLRSFNK
jgi:hypothetical protein